MQIIRPTPYIPQPTSHVTMLMRRLMVLVMIISFHDTVAQTRYYFLAGSNLSTTYYRDGFYMQGKGNQIWKTDGEYQTKGFGQLITADFVIEKKVNNTIHGITGITLLQAGYQNSWSTSYSEFKATYIGVPLLMRMNFANAVLLDVGPLFRVPVSARLKETALKGTAYEYTTESNIAPYLSKMSMGAAIQCSLLINRYVITGYIIYGKHQVDEDFADHWGLGGVWRSHSLFIRDMEPKFLFTMNGIKIGMRL